MAGAKKPAERLRKVLRDAAEDPISAARIARLWQSNYGGRGDLPGIESAVEETLGAIARQSGEAPLRRALRQRLEQFRHAALLVRPDGRIEAMNRAAYRRFDAVPGDQIEAAGYDLVPAQDIAAAIARILGDGQNRPGGLFLWPAVSRGTGRSATFVVFPYDGARRMALVFVVDPVWQARARDMARAAYALTEAELEVLSSFLDGLPLRRIAAARGRSHATVRTQFHALMGKFGVTSQAQLVQAALGLSQFVEDVAPITELAVHPHRRRLHLLGTGGRRIETILAGRQGGTPVVFLPDSTLFGFCAPLEAMFERAGLCVVSIGRPGYGATDPAPDGETELDCLAGDVAAVLGQLGTAPAVLCAHGSSAVFGFALAAARPDLFRQLVVFAATLPAPYLAEEFTRSPFVAAMLRARSLSPRLFQLIVRTSATAWRRKGSNWFARIQLARCASDDRLSQSAACNEEFELGLEAQMAQGFWLLERDLLTATGDWSGFVRTCAVPAVALHGRDDPITSIGAMRRFARDHPQLRLSEIEGAGYLLHLGQRDAFVAALAG